MEESEIKLRLIIIDSLPSVILSCDDPAKNNAILNVLINIMRYMTSELHVSFLIINLIINWNDGNFKNVGVPIGRVACGKYWKNVPNTRLKFEKLEGQDVYSVTVMKSDTLINKVNASVNIQLSDEGFK